MAIARKPGSKHAPGAQEIKAEQFIARADIPSGQSSADQPSQQYEGKGERRKPAMIRFDRTLLARVDRAAKRRGISRSAWIQYTVSRALDEEDA
jgi:hypothetical protein